METSETILTNHGIKPTANRILIARTLMQAGCPLSMTEIETCLETVDKSIISRTLAQFRDHHLVHQILSGDEARYEICHHDHHSQESDEHVHFYCEVCHRTFCFEELAIPQANMPAGYQINSINYVASGICPECASRRK